MRAELTAPTVPSYSKSAPRIGGLMAPSRCHLWAGKLDHGMLFPVAKDSTVERRTCICRMGR